MHILFQFQCSIACKRFQCAWWIFVCCSSNPYRKTPCNCRRQRLAHVDVCCALNNKIQFSFLSFFFALCHNFFINYNENGGRRRERELLFLFVHSQFYFIFTIVSKIVFSLLVLSLPLVFPYHFF